MTANVYFEARDQPLAGQVAVAQVTMNRVNSPEYPNDVCGVVYQNKQGLARFKCQFSWYCDGKSDIPREEEAWKRAQMVAMGVLGGSGHADLMDDSIVNYHALYVEPYWSHELRMVAQIGDHVFYAE